MTGLGRVRHHAVLWINDTPDEYRGNGEFENGPHPHGHVYWSENRRTPVQVSFDAMDGTSVRVSFDPDTGEVRTQDVTGAQR